MASNDDVSRTLARLTRIRPGRHWIVTCYLKLEPRDRSRGKYLIKLKNRVRQVAGSLDGRYGREEREAILRDLERIQAELGNSTRLPSSQGLAIFASGPLKLFEVVALPWVHRSRLAVDRTPLVRELASAEDEFGRMLTVVLDRTGARFFEITAFESRELDGLRVTSTRGSKYHSDRQGGPGLGEGSYHNRIRNEKQRHYAAVAQRLFELHRQTPADGLVIAAPGAESAAVEPFLHPYLAERLLGTARINPKNTSLAEVQEATLGVREAHERESERVLLQELEEARGAGWAVNGLTDTLEALAKGQLRTLVVDADSARPGFRCGDSGRLALTERECRGEGDPIPVLDVVDEAIEEALRQRVSVEVVYDAEAQRMLDGLAGMLRFR